MTSQTDFVLKSTLPYFRGNFALGTLSGNHFMEESGPGLPFPPGMEAGGQGAAVAPEGPEEIGVPLGPEKEPSQRESVPAGEIAGIVLPQKPDRAGNTLSLRT